MRKLILLCLFSSCYCIWIGHKQTVGVVGKLLCNRKPAAGVEIKLYEKGVFIHRKLAEVKTDNNGSFTISGTAKEFFKIDPQLNIYHRCNYKGPCYQKLKIKVPSKYINRGKQVKQYFNIKTLELAMKFNGQKTDCISHANEMNSPWLRLEPYLKDSIWRRIEPYVT